MTIEELKLKADEIKKRIQSEVRSTEQDVSPISDGIIDIERYFNSKYRILWILKEPYDDFDDQGNPIGGNWALNDVIRGKEKFSEFEGGRRTYLPMIYTSWGILNDFQLWGEMGSVHSDSSMLDALKSVAYINVKKLPGYKTSQPGVIEAAYKENKDVLLQQIETYSPDIIIGGSTLYMFFKDLGLSDSDFIHVDSVDYTIKDNRIYICAYHPSSFRVKEEMYCDDIIKAVKVWAKGNERL